MVTLREYANMHHISYEAVRSQVARYKEDLEGHLTIQNRVTLLDDWAVDFLNQRRQVNPVAAYNADRTAQIDELKTQIEFLKSKILNLQEQRGEAMQKVMELQEQANRFLEEKIKYKLVLEDYEAQKEQLSDALTKATAAQAVLSEVQERAERAEAAAREEREKAEQIRERMDQQQANIEEARNRMDQERARLQADLSQALDESRSYHKTIFGLYRKG